MRLACSKLCALLVLAACTGRMDTPVAPPPPIDGNRRLGRDVIPASYELTERVDPAKPDFSGCVTIALDVATPRRWFDLHADGLTITAATLTAGEVIPVTATAGEHGGLRIVAEEPVPAGRATLVLDFTGTVREAADGMYRCKSGEDAYVVTQFESTYARTAFPCFDEPGFKAPLTLSLAAPSGLVVVANTPETGQSPDGGVATHRFAPTAPLPTYLYAWAVGPWEIVEAPKGAASVPLRVIAPKGKGRLAGWALDTAPKLLADLERWFGEPYPFAKLDLIAYPDFAWGGMENAGLIAFREDGLLLDATDIAPRDRANAEDTLAHELAHMWFGDLVTPAWWDDLWLNEAFATWMATRCVEAVHPELDAALADLVGMAGTIRLDSRPDARCVRQPIEDAGDVFNAFDDITYGKGSRLVAMTEEWLGADVFQKGVRAYLAAHRNGTATSADLFAALEQASGKPVGAVLGGFLDRPGVPRIDDEWTRDGSKIVVRLRQSRWSFEGPAAAATPPWQVPVTVTVGPTVSGAGGSGAKVVRKTALVGAEGATVEFESVDFLMDVHEPNVVAGGGAYCVAVPPSGAALALARRLGSATRSERARLAAELPLLRDAGLVSAGEATAALLALAENGDRFTVAAACAACIEIANLATDDDTLPLFRQVVHSALVPTLLPLRLEPQKEDTVAAAFARDDLARTVGALDADDRVVAFCRASAIRFCKGPASVPQSVLRYALPVAARRGDADLWAKLRAILAQSLAPSVRSRVIDALRSFGDPALVERTCDLLLDGTLGPDDLWYVLSPARGMPDPHSVALQRWDWIERHYVELRRRFGDETAAGFPSFAETFRTAADRDRVAAFFARVADPPDGTERNLALALAAIRENEQRASRLRAGLVEILSRR